MPPKAVTKRDNAVVIHVTFTQIWLLCVAAGGTLHKAAPLSSAYLLRLRPFGGGAISSLDSHVTKPH